jgi:hypothetical protein
MADEKDYRKTLSEALEARAAWLDKSELPKLKERLRSFQTGFTSLYNLFLKKGLVAEDPYKQEVKVGELEVPETGPFNEAKGHDQLSLRLSNYDTQMDFLVNFYQFSADYLTIDRLKRIANLVKFIDWIRLTPDSQSPNTKAVAEKTAQLKQGTDALTMSIISESLSNLTKGYNPIMGQLKLLNDYRREIYKLKVRDSVTSQMSPSEAAQLPLIKKKFVQANPGQPFFPELVDEVIKEDNSPDGPALREKVLASLKVAESKPKAAKPQDNFKIILLDAIMVIGSTSQAFTDISNKMAENQALLEGKKKSLWERVKTAMQQMLNKEPEPVFYDLEYIDPIKGTPVKEKINLVAFHSDLDRKIKILTAMNSRGPGMAKLEAMQDEQIISFLEKNIRDLQNIHKTLSALDDFFKAEVDRADRDKVKGIKPELSTIKNAIVKANSKRHEYGFHKEEEEQFKRLGVSSEHSTTSV